MIWGGFMAIHIGNLHIDSYRGVRNLQIDNLGSVNILVGDNNSGKTSVLEAIQLLCKPNEYNLAKVALQRWKYTDGVQVIGNLNPYLYLFNTKKSSSNYFSLKIEGIIENELNWVSVTGELVDKLIDLEKLFGSQGEVATFMGSMENIFSKFDLEINRHYSTNTYYSLNESRYEKLEVEFIQVVDHIIQDSFSHLTKDKTVKEKAIKLLEIFDETITDIRYIKDEGNYFAMIETENGETPLSVYGDGIKKALTILNTMIRAENGVVLIDEFETSLHTTAMKQVFKFTLEVANQLNIQLFLTTHNIEAVDKLLESAEDDVDDIRVIRLNKKEDKTFARVLEGKESLKVRKEYNLELRV